MSMGENYDSGFDWNLHHNRFYTFISSLENMVFPVRFILDTELSKLFE